MSQAPGFDLLTLLVPVDGTNGVTIDAVATGEPERSWIVIDHPFRSFGPCSFLLPLSQLLDLPDSVNDDLHNNNILDTKK